METGRDSATLPGRPVNRPAADPEASQMHPLLFLAAVLANGTEPTTAHPRPDPAEPLPPIDDAALRAWRAWANGDAAGESWPASPADRPARTGTGRRRGIRPADGRA
jgi:hypothetical protein